MNSQPKVLGFNQRKEKKYKGCPSTKWFHPTPRNSDK